MNPLANQNSGILLLDKVNIRVQFLSFYTKIWSNWLPLITHSPQHTNIRDQLSRTDRHKQALLGCHHMNIHTNMLTALVHISFCAHSSSSPCRRMYRQFCFPLYSIQPLSYLSAYLCIIDTETVLAISLLLPSLALWPIHFPRHNNILLPSLHYSYIKNSCTILLFLMCVCVLGCLVMDTTGCLHFPRGNKSRFRKMI